MFNLENLSQLAQINVNIEPKLEPIIIPIISLVGINLLAGWLRYDHLKSIYKKVNKNVLFDLTERPNYLVCLRHPLKNLKYGVFGMVGASPE